MSISISTFESVVASYEAQIVILKARISELEFAQSFPLPEIRVSSPPPQMKYHSSSMDESSLTSVWGCQTDGDDDSGSVVSSAATTIPLTHALPVVECEESLVFKSAEWMCRAKMSRTLLHHLGSLEDISMWRQWALSPGISNSQKMGRCGYIASWSEFTRGLNSGDCVEAKAAMRDISLSVSTGSSRCDSRTNAQHQERNKIVADYIASLPSRDPASLKYVSIWGGILAPRRSGDASTLVILDHKCQDVNGGNVYIKESGELYFRAYKTAQRYGDLRIDLNEPCLVNSEANRKLAMSILNRMPPGPVYSKVNTYTQAVTREFGVCTNALRHYWASKYRADVNLEAFQRCSQLLGHSPSTALIHYST